MTHDVSHGQRRSWFVIRLLYATSVDRSSGRMLIEEDLWLFRASDAEVAYQEAVAGAEGAEQMGRVLVDGRPSAFVASGLGEYCSAFFSAGTRARRADSEDSPAPKEERLPQRYETYEFLGVGGMQCVGTRLRHGTELGRHDLPATGGRSVMISPKRKLLAFDPAGGAYSGAARSRRNAELFERYHWYLADQLFGNPKQYASVKGSGESIDCNGRLVLIRANSPEEAFLLATENGQRCKTRRSGHGANLRSFLGLAQLSLIADRFRNGCILRTDEYYSGAAEMKQRLGQTERLHASGDKTGRVEP